MLPVALTCPAVIIFPPVMLAALVMVDVAEINPPVKTLPPVTLAVAEINQVIDKYGDRRNLAIDVLKTYRNTLQDNSYLRDQTNFKPSKTLAWHLEIENTLKKTNKFVELWPTLAKEMQ